MLFKGNTREQKKRQRILDRAVSAWRDAEACIPVQRLSSGARANVRVLARRRANAAAERPLSRLFLPAARLAAAAAVPALILAVSFGWVLRDGRNAPYADKPAGTSVASISIESRKVDGQAVFDIANGGRVHRVYKSTSASDIGGSDLYATVEGAFSDTLAGDAGVVFYRID